MALDWDVFISYARADAAWVRTLADNLHQLGVDVFLDEWEIGPDDVLVHKIDDGLRSSRSGVLVVSPIALARPSVRAEFTALMQRAIETGQRLIPVLLKDAQMPPLLASRIWVDFRAADGPEYLPKVEELACALTGELDGPPERTGEPHPPPAPEPALHQGVAVHRVGDRVGRRRERRLILRALRDPHGAGVLIHGIGGVGKSTLAAAVLHRLADDGYLVVSVAGDTDPDRVLGAIATRMLAIALAHGGDERDPFRVMAGLLRDPRRPWRERFEILAQNLFAQVPVAFLLDHVEDNLRDGELPAALSALLALWLSAPRLSRLLITSRVPITLPDAAHERLTAFHLGPLSWAETRMLFGRLDGLTGLSADEQRRAYECVGGHPRALEHLDAILRSGRARFADVEARLRKHMKARGIADPGRWCADTAGDLDATLAETVTLAADDVLLDQLMEALADDPLARRLLVGAAVYRLPVDMLGLVWPVGVPATVAPDPERTARLTALTERLIEVRKTKPDATPADLGLSETEMEAFARDYATENAPPVTAPEGFVDAATRLLALSLLAPARYADDEGKRYVVQRWTADALAARTSAEEQAAAHRAAADYWLWRTGMGGLSSDEAVAGWLEARHHLHVIGDRSGVHGVTGLIVNQLETWGAWEWEERILGETLAWMSDGSAEAAACMGQMGIVAKNRGDDAAARALFENALGIDETHGNMAGIAASTIELGSLAERRGDADAAEALYRKALAVYEGLNHRKGQAAAVHNLGRIAGARGDLDAAEARYRQSLAIEQAIDHHEGIAKSYHHLGRVAERRGEHAAAEDWHRRSLAIMEQQGNRPGMATEYDQLGTLAQAQGRHGEALDWYRKALDIWEQIGGRDGIARSLTHIGGLYTDANRPADAVPMTLRGLSLYLGMRSGEAATCLHGLSRQRQMLGPEAFRTIVEHHLGGDNAASCIRLIDDYEHHRATSGNGATPPAVS